MRSRAYFIARCAALFALPCAAQRDPIEGKWAGKAGKPTDRPDIAFEFKRDSTNKIRTHIYQFALRRRLYAVDARTGDFVWPTSQVEAFMAARS